MEQSMHGGRNFFLVILMITGVLKDCGMTHNQITE